MGELRGKLALVTGASSGIGAACARRFAAEGAELVLWARREERLRELAEELAARHLVDVRLQGVGVRDRDAIACAAGALLGEGAVPQVLVNNAGLAAGLSPVHEGDPDDRDRMIDTNVKGLLAVTGALLPAMIEAVRRARQAAGRGRESREEETVSGIPVKPTRRPRRLDDA